METAARREIRVDRDLCMGSAQCSMYAPNTFGQDEDAVAVVTDSRGDSGEAIQAAIDSCPTRALSLVPVPGQAEDAGQAGSAAPE